jgi:iron complex transport system ATP-binding protein
VAMKDGEIAAVGPPSEVLKESLLRDVFEIEASIITDPVTGRPLVLPIRQFSHGEANHDPVPDLASPLPSPEAPEPISAGTSG